MDGGKMEIHFSLSECFIFLLDKRRMEVERWMSQNCHQAVFHTYFLKFEMTLNVEDLKKKNSSQSYLYTSVIILKGQIFLTTSG